MMLLMMMMMMTRGGARRVEPRARLALDPRGEELAPPVHEESRRVLVVGKRLRSIVRGGVERVLGARQRRRRRRRPEPRVARRRLHLRDPRVVVASLRRRRVPLQDDHHRLVRRRAHHRPSKRFATTRRFREGIPVISTPLAFLPAVEFEVPRVQRLLLRARLARLVRVGGVREGVE